MLTDSPPPSPPSSPSDPFRTPAARDAANGEQAHGSTLRGRPADRTADRTADSTKDHAASFLDVLSRGMEVDSATWDPFAEN